ncbi:MAG: hypothetical protein ACRYGR_04690 [Janthinobacterium lividum]
MKLYFAWINEEEIYDPVYHAQQHIEIFSFTLTEKEGEFPLVTIEIKNPASRFQEFIFKKWCFISVQIQNKIQLLFKGRLCPVPHSLKRETIKLNFVAQSLKWQEKLQELHQHLKTTSSWDPLFVRPEEQDNPQESLETRSELFYWCRRTGDLSLSNIFWGSQRVDLKDNHFYNSLNFKMGEPPLDSVRITLSAQWRQKYLGQTDITPFITSCFQEGIVNTLTGKDLQAKWWTPHEKIGHSGYWISQSFIKEIKPLPTGRLNLYPTQSSRIWISPDDPAYGSCRPNHPQQKYLKRSWYKIGLCVGWYYQQKRFEKVNFVLEQKLQIPTLGQNCRHLNLNLENIVQDVEVPDWQPQWNYGISFQVLYKNKLYRNLRPHRSKERFEQTLSYWQQEQRLPTFSIKGSQGHFFPTDRGHKAIEHAIEMARAHLAISARCIEISLAGNFEYFVSLTCDHSVQVRDHRLPGGSVWGKIKALKLCIDGHTGKQWGELILGVSMGVSDHQFPKSTGKELESFYSLDYVEPCYSQNHLQKTTSSGLVYSLQSYQTDLDKWIYPDAMTGRDIVERVIIKNRPKVQNDYLLRHQYPAHHSVEASLKKIPTQIHIQLADLKTGKTQIKNFSVDISGTWSAPQQINL